MKIKLTLLAILLAVTAAEARPPKMKTTRDSVSYAMGVVQSSFYKESGMDFNFDMMKAGIEEQVKGKARMDVSDANNFLQYYFTEVIPAQNLKESEEYLAGVLKNNKKARQTDSGLIYEVVREGNGRFPLDDRDKVTVHYKGTLTDGTVFDSSYDREEPSSFALNRVIQGWTEGMKLVSEGGKIKLWIPADLAYGAKGVGAKVGPNAALLFDVELLEVEYWQDEEDY